MITRVILKAGDTRPRPKIRVVADDGNLIDLKHALDLTWKMTPVDEGVGPDVSGPAQLEDTDDPSVVEYVWQPGETDVPGLYRATFQAIYRDGTMTLPTDGYVSVEIQPRAVAA